MNTEKEQVLCLPHGWERPDHLRHLLPPTVVPEELGVEPRLKPKHLSVGYGHPKWRLNCCAKYLPTKYLSFIAIFLCLSSGGKKRTNYDIYTQTEFIVHTGK